MTAVSGSLCRRCGQRPSTPDSGWCRACLDAEDRRRENLGRRLDRVHFPDTREHDLPVKIAEKASISPDKGVHYLG
jgi:ribosomal protein L37E